MEHQILLYYKYVFIESPEAEVLKQRGICERLGLKGRIIIAREGINGTVEGEKENTEKYIGEIVKDKRFADIHWKRSAGTGNAFPKLSVKLRAEIVTLGLTCDTCPVTDREGTQRDFICNGINPNEITGTHLKPEELHEWLMKNKAASAKGFREPREFYIVDMRNAYEHKVGYFEGSILPPMENFKDLPKVVEQIKHLKNKTVLTVCTGGVRCEKASGFLITQGFTDVYQLDGGIVSYMEKYPNENFKGKLYVFDGRVVMGTDQFYTDDPAHPTSPRLRRTSEIVGKCDTCGDKSENYVNCANPICHRHFIACDDCVSKNYNQIMCPKGCVISRHGRALTTSAQ